jgi:hypothetical protein
MGIISLILFFICFAIYTIFSKSDLYSHQHDASIKRELDKFNTNFKDLENLEINNNYSVGMSHIYDNK